MGTLVYPRALPSKTSCALGSGQFGFLNDCATNQKIQTHPLPCVAARRGPPAVSLGSRNMVVRGDRVPKSIVRHVPERDLWTVWQYRSQKYAPSTGRITSECPITQAQAKHLTQNKFVKSKGIRERNTGRFTFSVLQKPLNERTNAASASPIFSGLSS
jgi:hypothetical protein